MEIKRNDAENIIFEIDPLFRASNIGQALEIGSASEAAIVFQFGNPTATGCLRDYGSDTGTSVASAGISTGTGAEVFG